MSVSLSTLQRPAHNRRSAKRFGRGDASGRGSYSGRGIKGQKARSGGRKGLKIRALRRIIQQIPKLRGFKTHRARPEVVHVGDVGAMSSPGDEITVAFLKSKGLSSGNFVKILGDGAITHPITVKGIAASVSAKKKIEHAGGKIIV